MKKGLKIIYRKRKERNTEHHVLTLVYDDSGKKKYKHFIHACYKSACFLYAMFLMKENISLPPAA